MVPASPIVIVATALMTLLAVGVLVWVWRRGHFRDVGAQATVIFEPRDLRLLRPWESREAQHERERAHGDLLPPAPGEWGGHS